MIDFDFTSGLPTGTRGWGRLFEAIEGASPSDETEWIEYKAGVDPGTAGGRAHIVKAVLAFANRDPDRASRWLGGHALIVVGLEPGSLPGCPVLDPAQLHDGLSPLFKEPAPDYDFAYHRHKQRDVLVVTVSPPRQGDPIALPSRSSDSLVDGRVYVRRPGKSDNATSTDIRRLEARLRPAPTLPQLTVSASTVGDALRPCAWPSDWMEAWLRSERQRLMGPPDGTEDRPGDDQTRPLTAAERATLAEARRAMDVFAGRVLAEKRTREEFEAQVERYLAQCREVLARGEGAIAAGYLPQTGFSVENQTDMNLAEVEVIVRFESHVLAHEPTEPTGPRDLCPTPPRTWGPRRDGNFTRIRPDIANFDALSAHIAFRPTVQIENAEATTLTFPPVHLRPGDRLQLDGDVVVVVPPTFPTDVVRGTWQATATNISGIMRGELALSLDSEPVGLSHAFAFQAP